MFELVNCLQWAIYVCVHRCLVYTFTSVGFESQLSGFFGFEGQGARVVHGRGVVEGAFLVPVLGDQMMQKFDEFLQRANCAAAGDRHERGLRVQQFVEDLETEKFQSRSIALEISKENFPCDFSPRSKTTEISSVLLNDGGAI